MAAAGFASRLATRRGSRVRPTRTDALGPGKTWAVHPGPRCDAAQKDWLSRGGALTAHLGTLGKVTVRVVHEAVALPWPDEYVCLYGRRFEASDLDSTSIAASASRTRKRVWSRDIVLHIDGVPCVAAHSVTPLRDSKGVWRAMRSLRTRPLAELLYADRTVRRSHLVSRAAANRADPLRALVQRAINIPVAPQRLLARRSLFERHGAPLLVTECFLPAFWAMISAS